MSTTQSSEIKLPLDLGGGLILRRSSAADSERLAEFNGRIHGVQGDEPKPDERVAEWTRDLLRSTHPTFGVEDFTIVEEKSSGKIVSSMNLISQTWAYDGIPFGMGRPELVGTEPEYRNRGLVRRQFEVIHAWSAARGEKAQVITGIPYYYRLFGYEMAPNLGGGKTVPESQVKALKEDQPEPYRIRPVTEDDLPEFTACYALLEKRSPLSCQRSLAEWKYELFGKLPKNVNRFEGYMIEDSQGQIVGALAIPGFLWGDIQAMIFYELKPGVSYLMVTPAVLRFLAQVGRQRASQDEPLRYIGLRMGESHPAYAALDPQQTLTRPPYAFYTRVPDLVDFLRTVAPALEKRLEASACSGHSGEIKISFYRQALKISLDKGRISAVEDLPDLYWEQADACFPEHTFLSLLFQYRSLDELRAQRVDVWAKHEGSVLLNALFPKKPCDVWFYS